MTEDRRDPPPGFTVEYHDDEADWVGRNPDNVVITAGWPNRSQAVKICWDAHESIARMARNAQPGWFALAGHDDKVHILGGPYDTAGQAHERLKRYIDDGSFRVGYGLRDDMYRFSLLPEPAQQETR